MGTIKTSVTVDVDYVKAYINKDQRKLVLILQDESPQSPREWDNIGTIAYKHRNYILGEEEIEGDVCEWLIDKMGFTEEEADEIHSQYGYENNKLLNYLMGRLDEKFIWLPVYLYDHSGQSISTRSFNGRAQHAEWDSCMCGIIYVERATLATHKCGCYDQAYVDKYYPGHTLEEKMLDFLEGEIETFNQYIRGDVYGYRVIEFDEDHFNPESLYLDEGEEKHSCWGFFGDCDDENGWLSETGVQSNENGELIDGWEEL